MKEKFKVDFIGIGAPKSGTTWFFRMLSTHPQICSSVSKETSFFCGRHRWVNNALLRYNGKNQDKYRLFFKHCRPGKVKGEFTVHYLDDPGAAGKIHRCFPSVKLIVILRDPVSRLVSDYYYRKYKRKEIKGSLNSILALDNVLLRHGMYAEHLKRYYSFFDPNQIKILIYEELEKEPIKTLQEVYEFLGIDTSFTPPNHHIKTRINVTKAVRFRSLMYLMHQTRLLMIRLGMGRLVYKLMRGNIRGIVEKINMRPIPDEPISPQLRQRIMEIYRPSIKELEKLLGKDLSPIWRGEIK